MILETFVSTMLDFSVLISCYIDLCIKQHLHELKF